MSRPLSPSHSVLICGAALLFLAVNCVLAIQRTSITSDEVIHIAAGYYSLGAGENRMNAEHPPLAKMWSALPLLFFLQHDEGPADASGNFSQRGAKFSNHFWSINKDQFWQVWFWTRTAMVAFAVGLGILLFIAARRWFGTSTAVFAVLLYCLEPTILGHGRLVHTDVPGTFMYLLFFVVLDQYRRSSTAWRAVLVGFVTGLALVTKFSMIVLLPVLGVFFVVHISRVRRALLHPILAALVFVLTIQAAYGFHNPPLGADEAWILNLNRHPTLALRTIQTLSHVFPRDFLFGIYVVETHNSGGHSSSILGRYDYRGWWYYFPVAFALKTPIPFLLLVIAGIGWSFWKLWQREYSFLFALVPLAIYAAVAMSSGINIGIRHFLPAFPFLFMLAGALLAAIYRHAPRWGLIVAAAVLGIMGVEAMTTFPYYLSYMNQFKGQNPSWRYLSDSNVEWGDAVPELVAYLKERNVTRISGALLGGNQTLRFYGIEFMDLYGPPPLPQTQYVALGGSFLNGSTVEYGDTGNGRGTEIDRVNFFDAYRNRKPIAVFGNSIYLFENPSTKP